MLVLILVVQYAHFAGDDLVRTPGLHSLLRPQEWRRDDALPVQFHIRSRTMFLFGWPVIAALVRVRR